jgi:imidazolonepropionase-like amidohydrolase
LLLAIAACRIGEEEAALQVAPAGEPGTGLRTGTAGGSATETGGDGRRPRASEVVAGAADDGALAASDPEAGSTPAAQAPSGGAAHLSAGLAAEPALSGGGPGSTGGDPLLLTGARVLDPGGGSWIVGRAVLLVDGRIRKLAPPAEIRRLVEAGELAAGESGRPDGADRPRRMHTIDLAGLFLLPGLIDAHSHLLLHPYDETPWDDQVLRESLELRTLRGAAAARATLASGFTSLRDLGTEGAAFADVALRDAIEAGIIPGPRVFASTRAIVAGASYGPSGFDPRWEPPKGAQEADGVAGVRRAVREQVAAGADWIKVYADYRRRPGAPSTATFSQEELDALVDEAHAAGVPVAAHAVTDEGIRRAVRAGAETIEHGYQASSQVLELMRGQGVILCPTLAANEAMALYSGWRPGRPEPERIREARAMFQRALRAGVTIACGSDVGVFDHGDSVRELELMVDYGMRPAQALQAATLVAAELLGRRDELGQVAEGYIADLIAVSQDPLKSPAALWHPRLVVKEGQVVARRP